MSKTWFAVGLATLAVFGGIAFVGPVGFLPEVANPDTISATKPGKEQSVRVEAGRMVLPSVAGALAMVHFKVTNNGKNDTVFINGVAIENASRTDMFETVGPDMRPLTNIAVHPGETVEFGLDSNRLVRSDYGEDVLPGATVQMTLRFADSRTLSVPLKVVSAISQGGEVDITGDGATQR